MESGAILAFGIIGLIGVAGVTLWRLRQRWRDPEHAPASSGSTEMVDTNSPESKPVELSFGPSADKPLIRFIPYGTEAPTSGGRPVNLKSTSISHLAPVLQTLPTLLTGAEFASGNYMKVIVDGSLATSADGQSFLPYVRDIHGRVAKLARLKDARDLGNVITGAMVFQLVSVVVAQKHLADISKKLDEIKKGVDDIKTFLASERKSVITGAMKYLEQAVRVVMQGEFPEAVRHELESVERDLIGIQDHLVEELRAHAAEANKIPSNEWFGTRTRYAAIKDYQIKLQEIHQEWLLCVRARAACWQVLSAFPGNRELEVARKEAIVQSIEIVCGSDGIQSDIAEDLSRRIEHLNSEWNADSAIRGRKVSLREGLARWQKQIAMGIAIGQEANETGERVLSHQKPMVLAVKVEQGTISEAFDMSS